LNSVVNISVGIGNEKEYRAVEKLFMKTQEDNNYFIVKSNL